MRTKSKLGDILLSQSFITEEQLNEALARQSSTGEMLGEALEGLGFVNKRIIAEALRKQREANTMTS